MNLKRREVADVERCGFVAGVVARVAAQNKSRTNCQGAGAEVGRSIRFNHDAGSSIINVVQCQCRTLIKPGNLGCIDKDSILADVHVFRQHITVPVNADIAEKESAFFALECKLAVVEIIFFKF